VDINKSFREMNTAALLEATKQFDKEIPGLLEKPLTAAARARLAQASALAKVRSTMKTKHSHVLPAELAAALHPLEEAQAAFAAMPPSHQAEYIRWIAEAKKPGTRVKRAKQALKMILAWQKKRTR